MAEPVRVIPLERLRMRDLAQVGGKGLFVKELEVALAERRADIAVHSLKDVPMQLPAGFAMRTFGAREEPLDAFVSSRHASLEALPAGAVVGTSSLRRECQLRRAFPKLEFRPLRGNVNTRLAKLDRHEYDAIILAVAGLRRLGFDERIRAVVPASTSIPAIARRVCRTVRMCASASSPPGPQSSPGVRPSMSCGRSADISASASLTRVKRSSASWSPMPTGERSKSSSVAVMVRSSTPPDLGRPATRGAGPLSAAAAGR